MIQTVYNLYFLLKSLRGILEILPKQLLLDRQCSVSPYLSPVPRFAGNFYCHGLLRGAINRSNFNCGSKTEKVIECKEETCFLTTAKAPSPSVSLNSYRAPKSPSSLNLSTNQINEMDSGRNQ